MQSSQQDFRLPPSVGSDVPLMRKEKSGFRSFLDLLKFAFIALLIIVPVRVFIAQPFIVSGESMSPTFESKDYLIVDELSYRLHAPHRGDVIVFNPPKEPKGIYYIKRVIGLPGETVKIESNKVYIIDAKHPDGILLDEPYIKNIGEDDSMKTLGPDEYFVMGDNRPRSSDSRYWGTLPKENIVGRALIRLYPFDTINILPGSHKYANQ